MSGWRKRQVVELAKEAGLRDWTCNGRYGCLEAFAELVRADEREQALAAPVQEPVAWMVYTQDGQSVYVTDNPTDIQGGQRALPLYATPQQVQESVNINCPSCLHSFAVLPVAQRTWVGLTVDELITLEQKHMRHEHLSRAIEAKLKEKNQ